MRARQLVGSLVLLLLVVGSGWVALGCPPPAGGLPAGAPVGAHVASAAETDPPLVASGTIQAREVRIAGQKGGRILDVTAATGQHVTAGQLLVTLDSTPVLIKISLAEAAVATARADLAEARLGPRSEAVAAARAALALAEAQRDGAQSAYDNALDAVQNPQELDAQLARARTQLELAVQGVELAEAELAQTSLLRDLKQGLERQAADLLVRAAEEKLAAAQADQRAAQSLVGWLWTIRSNPLHLIAQANLAQGQLSLAEAGVAVAEARLQDLLDGPTPQEIAVAEARLRQADAELAVLESQLPQYELDSLIDGVVLSQSLRPGELAAPAATILTLADLSELTLEVYVPENRIGQVQLGQPVTVRVDSFSDRVFDGTVQRIADQPQFTPRNVVTAEERENTYYAVVIKLDNPEFLLKAGMPADAEFAP